MTFFFSSWLRSRKRKTIRSWPATQPPRRSLCLEMLEDRITPAPIIVNTAGDDPAGPTPGKTTLRDAINQAKAADPANGTQTIQFAIGNGPQTISILGVALPVINNTVIIDAATRPANMANQTITLTLAPNSGQGIDGLVFAPGGAESKTTGSNSQVLGLTIKGFTGNGIVMLNVTGCTIGDSGANQADTIINNTGSGVFINGLRSKNNRVIGDYIGTDANSGIQEGNKASGVYIAYSSQNVIGGLDPGQANTISQNDSYGVYVSNSDKNTVAGNYIGTKVGGVGQMGNRKGGVFVTGNSPGNTIGDYMGSTFGGDLKKPQFANVISGNYLFGVRIQGTMTANTMVIGNFIGTEKDGTTGDGNFGPGVILDGTTQVYIGGCTTGRNLISNNGLNAEGGSGILVENKSTDNMIWGNLLGTGVDPNNKAVQLGNTRFGIEFDATSTGNFLKSNIDANNTMPGVGNLGKLNKIRDPNLIYDNGGPGILLGPNGSTDQMPVLTSAVASGNTITIQGTLNSTPNSSFTLEFFGNDNDAAPGEEQGEYYLGTTTVTTDSSGTASFSPTFNTVAGNYVTATATSNAANGYTSEFSAYVPVDQKDSISLSSSLNPSQDGDSVTFTATVSGNISGGGTPTGTITFKDNGAILGTETLDSSGTATFSTSTLPDGGNDITAAYSGDYTYAAGTSTDLVQIVHPNSGVTLSANATTVAYGQPVLLMATVSGSLGTPTGTVDFFDGSTDLGTVTLDGNGLATLTTTALTAGSNDITAVYSGDSNYSSGTSSVVAITVAQASTTSALSSSLNPAALGAGVTFSVAVKGAVALIRIVKRPFPGLPQVLPA